MNIILLPLLSLWLGRSYQFIETEMFPTKDEGPRSTQRKWPYFSAIIVMTVVMGLSQAYLFTHKIYDPYWLNFFPQHHGDEYLFILLTAVSSIVFAIFKMIVLKPTLVNLLLLLSS